MILEAEILKQAAVKHGFTTRALGDVMVDLTSWEELTGLAEKNLVRLNQVHKTDVLIVEEPAGRLPPREKLLYDASATNRTDVVLSIRTADCVPILLYCKKPKAIAAVHAGWRGTLNGVVKQTLQVMQNTFDCKPEEVIAVIGPAICKDCYQVGEEVYKPFEQEFGGDIPQIRDQKPLVDLKGANRLWLTRAGVPDSNIEVMDYCTFCRDDLFFSYRRERANAGRQMAFISLPA